MYQEIIDKAIEYAYVIGDKDECFTKHVSHTIAAIYVGNGYKNVVDYDTPKYNLKPTSAKMNTLYKYWEEVENVCKEIGSQEFLKLVEKNKLYDFYFKYYLQAHSYLKDAENYKFTIQFNEISKNIVNSDNENILEMIEGEIQFNNASSKETRNEYIIKELTEISQKINNTDNVTFEDFVEEKKYSTNTDKIIYIFKKYIKENKI